MEAMVDIWGRRLRGLVVKVPDKGAKTVLMKVRGPTGEKVVKRHIKKHRVVFDDYVVWRDNE